jgi:hypothetical protein
MARLRLGKFAEAEINRENESTTRSISNFSFTKSLMLSRRDSEPLIS